MTHAQYYVYAQVYRLYLVHNNPIYSYATAGHNAYIPYAYVSTNCTSK